MPIPAHITISIRHCKGQNRLPDTERIYGSRLDRYACCRIYISLPYFIWLEESLNFYRFGILWLIDTFLQQIDSLWQQRPAAIKYTILDICAQQAAGAASLRIFRSDT